MIKCMYILGVTKHRKKLSLMSHIDEKKDDKCQNLFSIQIFSTSIYKSYHYILFRKLLIFAKQNEEVQGRLIFSLSIYAVSVIIESLL